MALKDYCYDGSCCCLEFRETGDFENLEEAKEAAWNALQKRLMVTISPNVWIGSMPYENNEPVPEKWTERTVCRVYEGNIQQSEVPGEFNVWVEPYRDPDEAKEAAWRALQKDRTKVAMLKLDGAYHVLQGRVTRYIDTGWLIEKNRIQTLTWNLSVKLDRPRRWLRRIYYKLKGFQEVKIRL